MSIGGINPDVNPLSQRQLAAGERVVSQQMGTLKDQKELEQEGAQKETTEHMGQLTSPKETGHAEHAEGTGDHIDLSGHASAQLTEAEQQAEQDEAQQTGTWTGTPPDDLQHPHKGHGGGKPKEAPHGGSHGSGTSRSSGPSYTPSASPKFPKNQKALEEMLLRQREESGEEATLARDAGLAPEDDSSKLEKQEGKETKERLFGHEEEEDAAAQQAAGMAPPPGGQGGDLLHVARSDDQKIKELRSGVNGEVWSASETMVGNQIENGKPSNSLVEVKTPDGIAPVHVQPEAYHPPLELCERKIGPLEPDLEEHAMAGSGANGNPV